MQSRVEQAEGGASGVTRRALRLLVLLGLGIATYVVLSLFEHAARADTGSIDVTNPVASVKTTTAAVRTALPKPKSVTPKSTAPTTRRATARAPEVNPPKVQAPNKLRVPR